MENRIPNFLNKMLKEQYGEELTNKIIEGYSKKRKTTFRVNSLKSNCEEIEQELIKNKIEFTKVGFYKDAYIINSADEIDIEKMEIYRKGKIYMQSLSSMLPPIILNPQEEKDILDMAAAPGGKTTQIAALTNNKSHITACEVNKIRIEKLKYNIDKQGAKNIFIMQKDSRNLDDFFSFDQILLDAPCSGSGTLELSNPKLEKYFTEKLINNCTKIQYKLFKKAIRLLKPGCQMVYSTCSILKEENEEILNKILKEEKIKIVPIKLEKTCEMELLPSAIDGTICVMPNKLYEGFFITKIVKI